MYYYIFDLKKCKKRSQVEEIKSYLGNLGISGEFSYPTQIQSVESLVDNAIDKKYTTIVAIGGEEIANRIATKLLGRKEALGVIPLEISENISKLIGVANWKEACDALRYRRIVETRLGQTAVGSAFLTHISLSVKTPIEVTLEFKDYLLQGKFKSLYIANFYPSLRKIGDDFLDIIAYSVSSETSIVKKLASFFGAAEQENKNSLSLLRARSLRIFTKTPIALVSGNQTLAKTPQLIESSDNYLRLIIAKKAPGANS